MRRRFFAFVTLLSTAPILLSACDGNDGVGTPTPGSSAVATSTTAPLATPTLTAVPRAQEPQLTYISENAVWTAGASGDVRRFADATPCPGFVHLQWSPDGERLACFSSDTRRLIIWDGAGTVTAAFDIISSGTFVMGWSPGSRALAYSTDVETAVVTPDGGQGRLASADVLYALVGAADLSWPLWSPDGRRLAFWDTATQHAVAYDVDSATAAPLAVRGRPMAWIDDNALLIAEGYVAPQQLEFPKYEMSLAHLDGRPPERRPELDRGRQFWLSDDRRTLAYVTPELQLALMDIGSGAARLIAGSSINYPSEGIPTAHVHFADDASSVYWIDADIPYTLYRADIAGATLQQLTESLADSISLSADATAIGIFHQPTDGEEDTLTIQSLEGPSRNEIKLPRSVSWPMTWRPAAKTP